MNAIPGGPFNGEKAKSAAVMQVLNERYGLDKPVGEQFFNYLKTYSTEIWCLSLKTGVTSPPPSESLQGLGQDRLRHPGRAHLCIILGAIAALNRNKWPDRVIIFSDAFYRHAQFRHGVFSATHFLHPARVGARLEYQQPELRIARSGAVPVPYGVHHPSDQDEHAGRPRQAYIRTARAKGVAHWKVIFVHALRNSLIPVITYVGPLTASILTGSLVIEKIFTIGGLGSKFVDSITNRDYTMIMGTTIFLAFIMILMNLVSDILYKLVDPRIKLD